MKKFLFTLFISVFILVSCKGAFSYLEEPETKLITVMFNNGNERYAYLYSNLRYEVSVRDEKNNVYKEYKERDVMTREEYIASYERQFGTITEKEREELLSLYDTYFSEELKYYTYPEMFNIVLPEGEYTFEMKAYGMSDFNKDVLLLQGETTANIAELSEEQAWNEYSCSIDIKLNEVSIPASITTGSAICSYNGSGTFDASYYFRYTTASDFEEKGNDANWKTSKDPNSNIVISSNAIVENHNSMNIKIVVNDLSEGSYCFQMVFEFPYKDAIGNTEEYFSYSTEFADIKAGFVTNVSFESTGITRLGEVTFVCTETEKKSVKYLYNTQYKIEIPTLTNYMFKGWSDEPNSTVESKKIRYEAGITTYIDGTYYTSYNYYPTYADVLNIPDFNPEISPVYCCLSTSENDCTGSFTLYAIWEKVQLPEVGTLQSCSIEIPNETYNKIELDIQYNDGSYESISQESFNVEETYYGRKNLYIFSIDNIQLKKTEDFSLIIKITLYDTDDVATVLFAFVPINNDGTIVGQIIDLSNERINHKTPGTYTINSTVQDLINDNSTPSNGCVYSLSTENELQKIGTWTKSGLSKGVTYVLYDNIEITTTSYSSIIGSGTNYPFEGIFDGNGKSITYNVSASSSPASLFDAVGSMDASVTAIIKNLTVYGSVSSSKDNGVIGGIVGIAFGNVIIDNCVSEVSVSGSKSSAVGGICGRVQNIATSCNVQIYNCINKGKVEGQNRVGGIIGDVADSTEIFNCANIGQISFSGDTGGGLIGAVDTSDSISKLKLLQNCYNMGEVSYTGTGTRAGVDYYLGGIIGGESSSNEPNFALLISNVSECYWESTLTDSAVASSTDDIEGLYLITDASSLNELLNSGISSLGENKTSCKNWKLVDIIVDGSSKTYPLF